METLVIATIKSWNIRLAEKFRSEHTEWRIYIITDPESLNEEWLRNIKPKFIFFPHWSWIIPQTIYSRYSCVVFHMTDLPFGRGGSPLQNLLARGIYQTKISAIQVQAGLDTGDVYFKESLDISEGSADDILHRAAEIVFEKMIPRFLENDLKATPQQGEPIVFERRRPEQSEIPAGLSPRQMYDYIRMLDGEGYPPAYTSCGDEKIYYRNARIIDDTVYADAEFRRDAE